MRMCRTYYNIAALAEDVPSQAPVMMTEDSVAEDLLALLTEEGDFVGLIDDAGTALQVMYEPRREKLWVEIPVPSRSGSYGRHLSLAQTIDVFRHLPSRFSEKMIDGMEFQPWS